MFFLNKYKFFILGIILIGILLFFSKQSSLRKITEIPPSKITVFPTPYPTWQPKPGVKRPTIVYDKFSFKNTDKTRKVEIVGCVVDNSEWGMSFPKKVVEVPNVSNIATETMKVFLKEAATTSWGGFPTADEIKNYFGLPGEVALKKLTIDKYGKARVYFSKELKAYGGGSARVACIHDSVELTLKQFPQIKEVVLCIEDVCTDQKGSEILQP